jgi:tetratricopeptide (TPR) repeat protein
MVATDLPFTFSWDEPAPRRLPARRLLVASVSERASRGAPLKLALPAFVAHAAAGAKHARARHLHAGGEPHLHLARAGAELQRALALLGGLALAGASRAAARVGPLRLPGLPPALAWPQRLRLRRGRASAAPGAPGAAAAALAADLCARGARYERALDVRAAAQCYEEAARLAPADLRALCLAAKQWTDLTFHHEVVTDLERQEVNLKAAEFAARAVAAHPGRAGGHVALCVATGRLALLKGNREKARLAAEAQAAARAALAADPESDLAHHLIGRWHYEMARVPGVVRVIARVAFNADLQPGTREEALEAYRRASALNPGALIHRAEAGRVLAELGRAEEAAAELRGALACEVDDLNAWHLKHDAEELLARLERRPRPAPRGVPAQLPGGAARGTAAAPPPPVAAAA